jgi:surfactin family lipopeptide synthetase A
MLCPSALENRCRTLQRIGEAPDTSMATSISALSHLSEAKRTVLEKYLRGNLVEAGIDGWAIAPKPSNERAPLSLAQEQLWIRAQHSAGMPLFYNESITIRRTGALDVSALEQGLTEVIRRHEIWRTTFEIVNEHPVQVIHPPPTFVSLPCLDLRNLAVAKRESEALRLATQELRRPFDLNRGPLLRATLVRLSDDEYRLFMAVHQIILDGVSAYQVFLPELVALYDAFSTGRSSPLPKLPIQYSDYAYWQRQWFKEKRLASQLEYWQRQFAGELPKLQWPDDYVRPLKPSFRGRIYPFAFPKSLGEAVKALSQKENVTLFVTLMAAFATLLHCYTRQNDIIVGTVAPAGRDQSEVQSLMGYFLNPVGIRTDLSDNPSFCELLQRTREAILGALAHDDVPFEHVAEALGGGYDASRAPICQVAASLEPRVPDVGSGWDMTPMDLDSGGAKWDLYFVWEDRVQGITGRVQYNPDLFKISTITGMIFDFCGLLDTITHHPQIRLSDLPLIN